MTYGTRRPALILLLISVMLLVGCGRPSPHPMPSPSVTAPASADDLVTVLPRDAIPAIFEPTFLRPAEADRVYDPDELVLGVEINGDARAYSIAHLSGHEVVNDVVGGRPIAVTW